jgi:hypothetical protein
VRKTGVETGRVKIRLAAGETVTVIAYAERLPQQKLADPPKWAVRLLCLRQQEEAEGFGLSLVSVCKRDEMAVDLLVPDTGGVRKEVAKRLAVTKVEYGRLGSEVFLKMNDRILATISPDAPGNNVVILYEDPNGRIEVMSFYDPKFVVNG